MPPLATSLTDTELTELLDIIGQADSVELKVTLAESDHYGTVRALGMDTLDAQLRHVYFFDTPDLTLDEAGLVVRARRKQGKGDDSVMKLRPVMPATLPDELRAAPSFNVEVDASPEGYVCSGSLKATLETGIIKETIDAGGPISHLFSKEQQAFYEAHAPAGIELDELGVLGPVLVMKLPFFPPEFDRKMVAEMWFYPDFSRVLELSTRCATSEAFQVAAETRAFFARRGVDLTAEQAAKTRTTLEFFAARA